MKINVITVCKNEEKIIPFFLDHYSSFCDSIMIFDGHSEDRSIEIAKQYPKVQLMEQDDGRYLDDGLLHKIRNECYKKYRDEFDWQIVVDTDEFVYAENIIEILERYKTDGITLPLIKGFQMGSLTFPQLGIPITEQIKTGKVDWLYYSKKAIFNPIIDINYTIGCHSCNPSGQVKLSEDHEIKLLHYKFLSYEYLIERSRWMYNRRSETNIKNEWGTHYEKYIKMTEDQFNSYINSMEIAV